MSVKINGLNKLKSNWYKTVMIRQENSCYVDEFIVDVKEDKIKLKTIKNNSVVNLNGCTDLDKIDYVVSSFLKDTRINELNEYAKLPYYDNVFNKVSGSRELYLDIKNSDFAVIYKKILNKYLIDRYNFAYNTDSNSYSLIPSYSTSSYEFEENNKLSLSHDMNLNNTIAFTFKTHNGKLDSFEKQFITEFINYKLSNIGEKAEIIHSKIYSEIWDNYICAKYLVCGDLKIRISDSSRDLSNCIYDLVYNYNNSREEIKKKQLKMEV